MSVLTTEMMIPSETDSLPAAVSSQCFFVKKKMKTTLHTFNTSEELVWISLHQEQSKPNILKQGYIKIKTVEMLL